MATELCVCCGAEIPEGRQVCCACDPKTCYKKEETAGGDFRANVLDEAKKIITTDRNLEYGKPEDSFAAISAIWNAQLSAFGFERKTPLTAGEAAQLMCGFKLARAATAVNPKADTFIDLAGYAACAGEIECG